MGSRRRIATYLRAVVIQERMRMIRAIGKITIDKADKTREGTGLAIVAGGVNYVWGWGGGQGTP